MVLYIIGLGLGDEKDITVRGLEAVRGSNKVVLEHYTSILGVDKAKLVRTHLVCPVQVMTVCPVACCLVPQLLSNFHLCNLWMCSGGVDVGIG